MERSRGIGLGFDVLRMLTGDDKVQKMMTSSDLIEGMRLNAAFSIGKDIFILEKLNLSQLFTLILFTIPL